MQINIVLSMSIFYYSQYSKVYTGIRDLPISITPIVQDFFCFKGYLSLRYLHLAFRSSKINSFAGEVSTCGVRDPKKSDIILKAPF